MKSPDSCEKLNCKTILFTLHALEKVEKESLFYQAPE